MVTMILLFTDDSAQGNNNIMSLCYIYLPWSYQRWAFFSLRDFSLLPHASYHQLQPHHRARSSPLRQNFFSFEFVSSHWVVSTLRVFSCKPSIVREYVEGGSSIESSLCDMFDLNVGSLLEITVATAGNHHYKNIIHTSIIILYTTWEQLWKFTKMTAES